MLKAKTIEVVYIVWRNDVFAINETNLFSIFTLKVFTYQRVMVAHKCSGWISHFFRFYLFITCYCENGKNKLNFFMRYAYQMQFRHHNRDCISLYFRFESLSAIRSFLFSLLVRKNDELRFTIK